MRDQLPKKPDKVETGIINLDNSDGDCTHWSAYAIDPRGIIYFDSYGLAPPKQVYKYTNELKTPIWYSALPTQTLNDSPICVRELLNVLDKISSSMKPPHVVVNEYTSSRW